MQVHREHANLTQEGFSQQGALNNSRLSKQNIWQSYSYGKHLARDQGFWNKR